MARQHSARRRNVQETPSPATHAGLRPLGIVVRRDVIDDQPAGEAGTCSVNRRGGSIKLLPARQQRGPVRQRPSVVLNVGNLEPVGAEHYGEIDDALEMFEVLSMND